MNYQDPELIDTLAAHYVIGTLRGPARARMARLTQAVPEVQRAVWRWERRLNDAAFALPEQLPPERVWRAIDSRIKPPSTTRLSLSWLRAWGVASAFAIGLLSFLLVSVPTASGPTHVAQVSDADSEPLWVISADLSSGQLRARALNVVAADLDRAFELWLLPPGAQPQSLGVLPVGAGVTEADLPAALAALLADQANLAVSIEPAGGSLIGVPTGPVVYQAKMVDL